MTSRADLIHYLRDLIVGAMHVGQLHGGDRLPSIRELGKRFGKNTRTVKAAYAALEVEGLVDVRGRSGVFVARQESPGTEASEDTARWLSHVIAEAARRRITVGELPRLIERFTTTRRVRCALVEVIEDAIVALRHELENEWGFDVCVVAPDALHSISDIDFYAATSFHAPAIHAAVEAIGKPLVVVTVHPVLKEALEKKIREDCLKVVAVDARFVDRIRMVYAASDAARVRFVNALDSAAVARLDPDERVLLTRAASQKLGAARMRQVFPHSPTISPETARSLAAILVRRNAES